MGSVTSTLILLRHGESTWNSKNLFSGWVDVPLSDKGVREASRAGDLMKAAGVVPDVLHTSMLRRAITTANLALDGMDRHWIPVTRSWRLNERHYGDLQGKNKKETREQYGDEQFMLWRRSYDVPPPPISADNTFSQVGDPRYDPAELPKTECLADVVTRLEPYLRGPIATDLAAGKTVLVVAHGNSLRATVKLLDGISEDEIVGLNIPTGIPLRYELDADLKPIEAGGEYLDPDAAAEAIKAVANQGR
ncbi:MAG: phosphoglyceromutase [Nakamurella sp.]